MNLARMARPSELDLPPLVGAFLFCIAIGISSVQAQTLTPFRIANGTSGENPAVLWVGVDQGFYRKHGLNVEVIYMRVGSLAASALVSGDVNAVLTSSNAVLNLAAGGLDVVIIGALFQHPDGDFLARPEFKRPEDLKGKLVAIQSIGGGGWANNMLALDYLGLDPDRDNIRFIVLGDQPSRIQALETGRAQASWMGSTFSAPLKKKGYTLLLDLSRAPIPYVGSSLVVRKIAESTPNHSRRMSTEGKTSGYAMGAGPFHSSATFSSMNDTPMAVISGASRGERRSGHRSPRHRHHRWCR